MRPNSLSASLVFCSIWCGEMRRVMKSCSFPENNSTSFECRREAAAFYDGTKQIGFLYKMLHAFENCSFHLFLLHVFGEKLFKILGLIVKTPAVLYVHFFGVRKHFHPPQNVLSFKS